jgi:adenosylhomocysteine nucleosidase
MSGRRAIGAAGGAGTAGAAGAIGAGGGRAGLTAIVSPLAAEIAGVLAAVETREVLRLRASDLDRHELQAPGRGGWRATLGRLGGEEVALMATGDGATAAAAGLRALLDELRPRRVLVLGVAGGLTPGLAAGTLVVAREVVDADGRRMRPVPDTAWLARALEYGATAGIAISVRRILADPDAKREALGTTLAAAARRDAAAAATVAAMAGRAAVAAGLPKVPPQAAAAVGAADFGGSIATADLESAAYVWEITARSLPYLVVRAVLDPAEETLPLDFEGCRGAAGKVSNARVVLRALGRPRSFAGLWRLRARVRDAAASLAALAEQLVAERSLAAITARPVGERPGAAVGAVTAGRRA